MKKQPFLLFSLIVALAACEPTIANRGSLLDSEVVAQIKPGMTTREEVAIKLGSPTAISTVDENTWYYVGRQTKQYSFLSPEVMKQQAIEVSFDDKGVVTNIENLDLPKAEDTSPVDRTTPTYGQKTTLVQEIFGTLKRARPGMMNKKEGGGT
ncbi:MAG: outer membrane protein assembly factor BamE [Bdellovibrionales bacterium]